MFTYVPDQPERITTWFYDTAVSSTPHHRGFIYVSPSSTAISTERLVAHKGAEGLYSIRKDEFEGDVRAFKAGAPFSLTGKFLDFVRGHNDYTYKYHEVLEVLKGFEQEHREKGYCHRYPGDVILQEARMVSRLPTVYLNVLPVIKPQLGDNAIM